MTVAPELWIPGQIVQPRHFTADEIDLFRFSAVTWNAHRIHYDAARAASEGLPGLPVQAHLHGAWFAQVARSIGGPSARLRSLSWTNRAPVVAGDRVEIGGTVESVEDSTVTLALTETGDDGGMRAEGSASVEVQDVTATLDRDALVDRYRTMARIRAFELAARRLQAENRLWGTLHLSIGQEACAAGVCGELRIDDRITTTHRGHGHCLAKGGRPELMFAELLGRSTGYGKGRSGSMHIADAASGNLGANAIVGAGIPIAVGAAFAANVKGEDWVAVSFFGEGAVGEGVFHESLNLAALWKLPVIFACENNHYAELSPEADVLAVHDISALGKPFGVAGERVDGNDVDAVANAARRAVTRARAGEGPTLLELDTYRQSGHFEGDQMRYRTKEEAAAWAGRDPLLVGASLLAAAGVDDSVPAGIGAVAEVEMAQAIDWADAQPKASADSLFDDVYDEATSLEHPWLARDRERV